MKATHSPVTSARLNSALDELANSASNPKELRKLMKSVKWQLRGPNGEYVGLSSMTLEGVCAFVPQADAQVFDGRDNPEMKLRYYSMYLPDLTLELL